MFPLPGGRAVASCCPHAHTQAPRPCTRVFAPSHACADLWPPTEGVGAVASGSAACGAQGRSGTSWEPVQPLCPSDAGERLVKRRGWGRGWRQPQTHALEEGPGDPAPASPPHSPLSTPSLHLCPWLPASFQTFRSAARPFPPSLLSAGATRGRPAARSTQASGQEAQAHTLLPGAGPEGPAS